MLAINLVPWVRCNGVILVFSMLERLMHHNAIGMLHCTNTCSMRNGTFLGCHTVMPCEANALLRDEMQQNAPLNLTLKIVMKESLQAVIRVAERRPKTCQDVARIRPKQASVFQGALTVMCHKSMSSQKVSRVVVHKTTCEHQLTLAMQIDPVIEKYGVRHELRKILQHCCHPSEITKHLPGTHWGGPREGCSLEETSCSTRLSI